LELFELVEQPVVLLVGNLGIVVDVVTLFVMTDRVTKLFDAFLSRLFRHAITGRCEDLRHKKKPWPRKHESTKKTSSSRLRVFVVAFFLSGSAGAGSPLGRTSGRRRVRRARTEPDAAMSPAW